MSSRPSLLARLWRKLRDPQPSRPKSRSPRPAKIAPSLEPLEGRIAPATVINPTTVMFQDVDGDIVTVKFSKPLFALSTDAGKLAAANAVLKFSTGNVDTVATTFTPANPGQQLQLIDLTAARSVNGVNVAIGTSITVSVAKGLNGDGFTNIGYIHAFEAATSTASAKEVPLGAVTIAGDLGQIDAGGLNTKVGLASLKVKSLGVADPATTQPAATTALPSSRTTVSNIIGALGPVTIADDLKGTLKAEVGYSVYGVIGNVTIGGSLIGGATEDSGSIISDTNIGVVKIGNAPGEGIVGGSGINSGTIRAGGYFTGKITSVTVSGDVVAGTGTGSATIFGVTSVGAVKIGGNLDGTSSGSATGTAGIQSDGTIASVTIGGAFKGGANALDGFIQAGTNLGAVKIGSILGGAGLNSAAIIAGGKIASITVLGDVTGGDGIGSASITSGSDFDLVGDIGAIKIGGKLTGGGSQSSGSIGSGGKIASVTIGPAAASSEARLIGGGGLFSGSIFSRGAMGAVKITGSVTGGGGDFSGAIVSQDYLAADLERPGTLGAVTITGSVTGGNGDDSGLISADGRIASVTIGTLNVTTNALAAGAGDRSGSIRAGQGIVEAGVTGAISLKGSLVNLGGGLDGGGIVSEGKIASVTIAKSIDGGTIRSGDDIPAITVSGDVANAKIAARGLAVPKPTSDLAIGKITINGSVSNTSIRAGYDTQFVNAVNPDAQIGTVTVKGSWTASDLIAGVFDGSADGFGTQPDDVKASGFDNAKIVSQIASIVISGTVTGSVAPDDHFGFVAQKIGAMKIGGVALALTSASGDKIELANTGDAPTNDVTVLEIAI